MMSKLDDIFAEHQRRVDAIYDRALEDTKREFRRAVPAWPLWAGVAMIAVGVILKWAATF